MDFSTSTGITTGGLDLILEQDDASRPIVFEVSPIFDMNPAPPGSWRQPYATWKETPDYAVARLAEYQKLGKFALANILLSRHMLYIDGDCLTSFSSHDAAIWRDQITVNNFELVVLATPASVRPARDWLDLHDAPYSRIVALEEDRAAIEWYALDRAEVVGDKSALAHRGAVEEKIINHRSDFKFYF